MSEPLEIHYGEITRNEHIIYVKRGEAMVELGRRRTDLKAETTATMIAAVLAATAETWEQAPVIRDEKRPRRKHEVQL